MLMRPYQNLLAIVATFLVAGALLPWNGRLRLTCAFAAIAIVLFLFVVRMRGHALQHQRESAGDLRLRVERIRKAREKRFNRR